jgi:hypothetical protein
MKDAYRALEMHIFINYMSGDLGIELNNFLELLFCVDCWVFLNFLRICMCGGLTVCVCN